MREKNGVQTELEQVRLELARERLRRRKLEEDVQEFAEVKEKYDLLHLRHYGHRPIRTSRTGADAFSSSKSSWNQASPRESYQTTSPTPSPGQGAERAAPQQPRAQQGFAWSSLLPGAWPHHCLANELLGDLASDDRQPPHGPQAVFFLPLFVVVLAVDDVLHLSCCELRHPEVGVQLLVGHHPRRREAVARLPRQQVPVWDRRLQLREPVAVAPAVSALAQALAPEHRDRVRREPGDQLAVRAHLLILSYPRHLRARPRRLPRRCRNDLRRGRDFDRTLADLPLLPRSQRAFTWPLPRGKLHRFARLRLGRRTPLPGRRRASLGCSPRLGHRHRWLVSVQGRTITSPGRTAVRLNAVDRRTITVVVLPGRNRPRSQRGLAGKESTALCGRLSSGKTFALIPIRWGRLAYVILCTAEEGLGGTMLVGQTLVGVSRRRLLLLLHCKHREGVPLSLGALLGLVR
eukprot:977251-Rhodomonas_salina.1